MLPRLSSYAATGARECYELVTAVSHKSATSSVAVLTIKSRTTAFEVRMRGIERPSRGGASSCVSSPLPPASNRNIAERGSIPRECQKPLIRYLTLSDIEDTLSDMEVWK